jgi:hypothetical protein
MENRLGDFDKIASLEEKPHFDRVPEKIKDIYRFSTRALLSRALRSPWRS